MQHWNENQVCVIDTETTGTNPLLNEIVQICILPLDSNLDPRKDVIPFYVTIKPESPEYWNPEAKELNRELFIKAMASGHDSEKVKDLLRDWVKKLKLPLTKWGTPHRIIPLGHNFAFDRSFLMKWLGDQYEEFFDGRYRDTMTAALYLNDRAGFHANKVEYAKVNLRYLCSTLKIDMGSRAHDALADCLSTAQVYKALCRQGLLG
jgi:DNA polymerase III epsilon subunit-like protein